MLHLLMSYSQECLVYSVHALIPHLLKQHMCHLPMKQAACRVCRRDACQQQCHSSVPQPEERMQVTGVKAAATCGGAHVG